MSDFIRELEIKDAAEKDSWHCWRRLFVPFPQQLPSSRISGFSVRRKIVGKKSGIRSSLNRCRCM